MKKYLIISIAAVIGEIASTFYITFVADKNPIGMFSFAFIGPFLGLPFVGYMIQSKNWKDRAIVALSQAIGYLIGSIITYYSNQLAIQDFKFG
jgi:hypothetical protein